MTDPKRDWKWTFRDLFSHWTGSSERTFSWRVLVSSRPSVTSLKNNLDEQSGSVPNVQRFQGEVNGLCLCNSDEVFLRSHMSECENRLKKAFGLNSRGSFIESMNDELPVTRRSDLIFSENPLNLCRVPPWCRRSDSYSLRCQYCAYNQYRLLNNYSVRYSCKNPLQIRTRRISTNSRAISKHQLPQFYNNDVNFPSGHSTTSLRNCSSCDNTFPSSSPALDETKSEDILRSNFTKKSCTNFSNFTKYVPNSHFLISLLSYLSLFYLSNFFSSSSRQSCRNLFPKCSSLFIILTSLSLLSPVLANRPPRFLINGQTEIVIRLKEGSETPIGTLIYRLRGVDPDNDPLTFGIRDSSGSDVIRLENIGTNEANLYLNKELDREVRDEYMMVLTLTDGRLGDGNFITQSLLLLVEDVNDNEPIFKRYQASVSIREDAAPGILTSLEATDADEGPYGQVFYYLQENDEEEDETFSVSTVNGKGVVRLIGKLDYERKSIYHFP